MGHSAEESHSSSICEHLSTSSNSRAAKVADGEFGEMQLGQEATTDEKNVQQEEAVMTKDTIRKICKEAGLYHKPLLNEKLYLHRRGFKLIENLDEYTEVRALWLNGNSLRRVCNLHPLSKLKCLFLQQNCLTRIENLSCCPELTYLDFSENNISRIEGLEGLRKLSSFKIARNRLTSISDILELTSCPSLTNVDVSYNNLGLSNSKSDSNSSQLQKASRSTSPTSTTKNQLDCESNRGKCLLVDTWDTSCQTQQSSVDLSSNGKVDELGDCLSAARMSTGGKMETTSTQVRSDAPTTPIGAEFVECFKCLPQLASLYMMGNPVTEQILQYRRTMIANISGLKFLDDRPVKQVDKEAAIAWFIGGENEERKVLKAFWEKEQAILRGHVSSLRILQKAHREKMRLALDRIAREDGLQKARGLLSESTVEGEQQRATGQEE